MTGRQQNVKSGSLKIRGSESERWRDILCRSIPLVYGMFVRKGINPALAEELTQKTVFDAVKSRNTFSNQRGSIEQWIVGIAKNNLALEMRQRASRPKPGDNLGAYLEAMDTEPLPDELLEKEETRQLVRAAMQKLDARQRQVLDLKYVENLSARTIAQLLQITEKAVHSLLYRARIALRDELIKIEPLYRKGQ